MVLAIRAGLTRGRVSSGYGVRMPEPQYSVAGTGELGSKSNTGAGEMTRRACLSSKSNTVVREIVYQLGLQESVGFGHKNGNISPSLNSFRLGPIYFGS